MIFILFILVFIAGIAKAVMDTLQFHFYNSRFKTLAEQYWNPARSWKNKYSNLTTLSTNRWNGLPIPVALTDAWHLFQSIFLTSLFAAIVTYDNITPYLIIDFVLLRSAFGAAFGLFYNYLLINKK